MSKAEVLEQIHKLPPEEQREIAETVLDELAGDNDDLRPEQIAELDRRAEDALRNPGRGTPWAQVRDEMLRKFKQ